MNLSEIKPLKDDEIRKVAPWAVAALIRSGKDARSLFNLVQRLAITLDEPIPEVAELGTLLDSWELHLPPGHRAGDAPYWSGIVALCYDIHTPLTELDCLELGNVEVLLKAIREAARAHLEQADETEESR